jgi:hypothetical protein
MAYEDNNHRKHGGAAEAPDQIARLADWRKSTPDTAAIGESNVVRIGPRYQRLARECLDLAERAEPADREKLHRIAEIWLSLATDHLTEVSRKSGR